MSLTTSDISNNNMVLLGWYHDTISNKENGEKKVVNLLLINKVIRN